MSHTAGPWEARWPKFDSLILDAEDRVIASVSFSDHVDAECEANAHLIAAAPELLAACKALRDGAYGNPGYPEDNDRIDDMADAAIAKAEGR